MQNVGKGCCRIRREKDYTYICLRINRCIMSKTYVYVYAKMQFDGRATSASANCRFLENYSNRKRQRRAVINRRGDIKLHCVAPTTQVLTHDFDS